MRRPALAALLLVLAACSADGGTRSARPNEVQVVEPAGRPNDWSYAPKELAVATGTTVTFVNRGKEFHTITSDDPGRPFDLSIDSSKSATFTFTRAGTFRYHCGVHPQMTGTIRVCDGGCG